MSVEEAEQLLNSGTGINSLLEAITWRTKDILNLRARMKCAQGQETIDRISKEISRNESVLDQIKKEIVRKCS